MTHTLKLSAGARRIAYSVLSIPEQFKSPSEIVRAARLQDILHIEIPENATKEELDVESPVEITEAQRELLKKSVDANAPKLPVGAYSMCLLTQLGFDE